jgi:uncharacterized protein
MTPDPVRLRQLAEAGVEENFQFRDFLKHRTRLASEAVDRLVFEIAAGIWKRTDCTACANCCLVLSPALSEGDVERLAGHLGMGGSEFESKYLQPAEGGTDEPWVMRERPRPFLKDNRCAVYEHRPASCRGYPYLDRPKFTARTLGMIGRLSECPVVVEVWENLKQATRFRSRSTRRDRS